MVSTVSLNDPDSGAAKRCDLQNCHWASKCFAVPLTQLGKQPVLVHCNKTPLPLAQLGWVGEDTCMGGTDEPRVR